MTFCFSWRLDMWGGPEDDDDNWDAANPALGKYVTKDSGEKAVHSDGVQRDTQVGKTKFTLMFPRGVPMREQLFTRVAELYTRGGEKYGDRNWENSCAPDTLDHHLEALWRHFMSFFFEENTEEDHAAAIIWNINAVELTRRNIRQSTPKQLTEADLPNNVPVFEDADEDLPPILALLDNAGDYWTPNDDGTFDCWYVGRVGDDSVRGWYAGRVVGDDSVRGWTPEDIQDAGFGPFSFVYEPPEEGFPWD
jgi:hypothetical protein